MEKYEYPVLLNIVFYTSVDVEGTTHNYHVAVDPGIHETQTTHFLLCICIWNAKVRSRYYF